MENSWNDFEEIRKKKEEFVFGNGKKLANVYITKMFVKQILIIT